MLRKTILAIATTAALGAAALSPGAASAEGWHGGWHDGWHGNWHRWHGGWHGRFFRPGFGVYAGYGYGYGGCWVRRWVDTPYGPAYRLVNRCY
jgi:hypothetical protein